MILKYSNIDDVYVENAQNTSLINSLYRIILILLFLNACNISQLSASDIESEYYLEEIVLILDVKDLGKYYVDALYATDSIYLSITDVFQELGVNQKVSLYYDTISGFLPRKIISI